MTASVFWMILLALLALCVGFLVPLLVQLRRTAQRAERFLDETERDLGPLLRELRDTSERASRLARVAEEDISRAAPLFRSLGEAGQSLHTLSRTLNADLVRYAGNALGFWLGVRSMKKSFRQDRAGQGKEADHGE